MTTKPTKPPTPTPDPEFLRAYRLGVEHTLLDLGNEDEDPLPDADEATTPPGEDAPAKKSAKKSA